MIKPNLHLTANQRFALTLTLIVCVTIIIASIIVRPPRYDRIGNWAIYDRYTGSKFIDGNEYTIKGEKIDHSKQKTIDHNLPTLEELNAKLKHQK